MDSVGWSVFLLPSAPPAPQPIDSNITVTLEAANPWGRVSCSAGASESSRMCAMSNGRLLNE